MWPLQIPGPYNQTGKSQLDRFTAHMLDLLDQRMQLSTRLLIGGSQLDGKPMP